jgi:CheY-like chemotaxis protein
MEKPRIMIVDDTPVNLELLHKLLSAHGYQTAAFTSGELAWQALETSAPDLILLDINMPGMNGYELCGRIKKRDDLKDIPVIFLSGMNEMVDKLNAFHTGGVDYITKPFQGEEVLIRVKTHLKIRQQQRQLKENFDALQKLEQTLEESLETLKKDEEAGRMVQFKLLPKNGVMLGSYEFTHFLKPSMYMSGDFLDYFELDDKYAVFYFADVSGHGAASAFITFLMKSFIGSFRTSYLKKIDRVIIDPAELLGRFNQSLIEENLDKFITLFFGVLDKSANKLIFANGGHFPMPFLCSEESSRQIIQKSIPIGMFENTVYSNLVIDLPEEFSFMIFSDGALEIIPDDNIVKQLEFLEQLAGAVNGDITNVIRSLKLDMPESLLDDVTIMLITRRRTK